MKKTIFYSVIVAIIEVFVLAQCSTATPISTSITIPAPTSPEPTSTLTAAPSVMPTRTLLPATPTKAATASPMPEGTVRVEIFADQGWQSAGMILKPGQPITIQASGSWKHAADEVFYGPDGIESMDTNSVLHSSPVLHSAPMGSLIGRIEGGQPFEIGAHTTWVADRAGRLYLSMNDRSGMFGDNQGSLVVHLGLNACGTGWSRLSVGGYAAVTDEQADPNRVRSAPDTSAEIIAQLYPGTIVRVSEGPVCANSLVFWKVENESIPGETGWTAEGDGSDYYMEPYPPLPPGSSTSQP